MTLRATISAILDDLLAGGDRDMAERLLEDLVIVHADEEDTDGEE